MSEFLAEARILVRPDTTKFRAELIAEVQASVAAASKLAVIPVQAQVTTTSAVGSQAMARSAQEAAGALRVQTQATAKASSATSDLARIQVLATKSTNDLATAQLRTITAATEQGAAQITAAAAVRSAAIAQEQLALALKTGNVQMIEAAALTNLLAASYEREALAALAATRAENAHASSLANVQKAGIASTAGLLGLRGAVLTAGAGFIGATVAFQAGIKAIQSAAQLETELNVFRVTVGATSQEMASAAENARALGQDLTLPGVSAVDAAQAQLQLARAGLEVQDAIAGTRGVLQLATAAQIEFGRAADLVGGNLNSFNLAGSEAVRVADLLTGAANESQGSIEDMGIGLRQVAGAANQLGLTVDDTVTLLTQLTRAGLAGSDAGTTLRVALVRLARPDTRAEVEKLVGSLEDLNGNLDPRKIVEFGEEISKSGGKLDQTNKLYELFGENALRVVGLLGNEGVAGFDALNTSVTEAGLAAEVAGARMAGFEGDVEALSNSAAALGTSVGQLVLPPLSLFIRALADVATTVNTTITGIRDLASEVADLGRPFADAIPFIDKADGGLQKIATTALKLQVLGPALFGASLAMEQFGDEAEDAGQKSSVFGSIIDSVTSAISGLTDKLDAVTNKASPQDEGLGVQQILNRVAGLDAAEVRARISGDTNTLLGVLQDQQEFLEAQLDRQFVKNRPALRRQLESALLGVTNDIAAIAGQAATEKQRAASTIATSQKAADQALLDAMSSRREDISNSAQALAAQGNLQGAIKLLNSLQAIIKQQIIKIRATVKDEEARAAAIRALRQARNASQREEDALNAQITANQQQQQATIQQLNIDIAIERGNEAAAKRAINARIRTLNAQIDAAKGDQVKVKQLILERERLKNQLNDLDKVDKESKEDARKRAAGFFFEQLQAQQGFAANLLGNLIPRDQTAGLVGVPSDNLVGGRISAESNAAAGRAMTGPTAGQAQTTNAILQRILAELKNINNSASAPEAVYQKKMGLAAMDGGGGNVQVM